VTTQGTLLGTSVYDAAQRAADLLAVLLPRAGNSGLLAQTGERGTLIAMLRAHGEPEPIEISDADLAGLRQAALDLQEVFAAGDVATAADRINALLGARAHPPRLTAHGGGSGWHLHVDGSDDASWANGSSPHPAWRWPCCWPSGRRRPAGSASRLPARGRS
jgi:hypothetical protein